MREREESEGDGKGMDNKVRKERWEGNQWVKLADREGRNEEEKSDNEREIK